MDVRIVRLACWNLRFASLFLFGPIAGLVLLALVFGLTLGMQRMALGMLLFVIALFAILIKGEYDRLCLQRR